jgi:hypothetical protein
MLTRPQFALRTLQIMTDAAEWSRYLMEQDALHARPLRREAVEQFISTMRKRLDDLEKEMDA